MAAGSSSRTRRPRRPVAAARRSRPDGAAPRGVRFAHVAFDLDGTLIDSRHDLASCVNHVLRTMRLPELDPKVLYGYVGEGARVLVERALGPSRCGRFDEGVGLFMEYYGDHLLDATRPYPGMVELL